MKLVMSMSDSKWHAIQLSPQLHNLITRRLSKLEDLTEFHNFLSPVPIYKGMRVIIYGEAYTYKLLNKRQYDIRKNQCHLLKQYRTAINNHSRLLAKDEGEASELFTELKRLSQRIGDLDKQLMIPCAICY